MGRKTGEVNSKEILYLQGDSISMKGYLGPSMARYSIGLTGVYSRCPSRPISGTILTYFETIRATPKSTSGPTLGPTLRPTLGPTNWVQPWGPSWDPP